MPGNGKSLARVTSLAPFLDSAVDSSAAAAEARFEALLEAAQDAIVVIDEQGVIRTFSPGAEQMFGYERREIVGQRIEKLMPEPYSSEHDGYIQRFLRTGRGRIIGKGRQVEAQRCDGSVFQVHLAIGDAVIDGRHVFVGIIHDLTKRNEAYRRQEEERKERLRAQREAEHLRESLAHAGRLGLLDSMASSIAHELAQPLSAILNYAETCRVLLQQGALDEAQLEDILGKIATSAQMAKAILTHVRGFVGKRESLHHPVVVQDLVREAVALADMQGHQVQIKVEADVDADMPQVRVDEVQIQQVILNLLRNAMESMKDTDPEHRRVRLKVSQRGSEVHFRISDSGETIAPEMEDKLFRPFVTTKETGMGMGLSICRSILDGHGGRIWFSRNRDRGTTFHFTLPVATLVATTSERQSSSPTSDR